MAKSALIVGAGAGLSSSLAFQCKNSGMHVALAARDIGNLKSIREKTGASLHKCDASKIEDVNLLFEELDAKSGTPDLVVYNPSRPWRNNTVAAGARRRQRRAVAARPSVMRQHAIQWIF